VSGEDLPGPTFFLALTLPLFNSRSTCYRCVMSQLINYLLLRESDDYLTNDRLLLHSVLDGGATERALARPAATTDARILRQPGTNLRRIDSPGYGPERLFPGNT
jgi:hypothetical protein